jgi:fructokinase
MIAILGEALIDFIGKQGDEGNLSFTAYPGGCALNAATAAARLDTDVLYIGRLSSDMFGKQMQEYFKQNSVKLVNRFCNVPENSMIGFAHIDKHGSASYAFYSEDTTITHLTSDEIISVLSEHKDIAYLHIGSVAVALDESGNHILQALHQATSLPLIFFDPNVRPTVIQDLVSYRERVKNLFQLTHVVKLSNEDLELLFPDVSLLEGIHLILEMGVRHVILTKGKDGLQWISHNGMNISVPAIENPIADTVGAGDTVSGAILTYFEEHQIGKNDELNALQVKEALEFAALAAAVTTSRKGANPPMRNELGMFSHLQKG